MAEVLAMHKFIGYWKSKKIPSYGTENSKGFVKFAHQLREALGFFVKQQVHETAKLSYYEIGRDKISFYIGYNDKWVYFTYQVPVNCPLDLYNAKNIVAHYARDNHDKTGKVIGTSTLGQVFAVANRELKKGEPCRTYVWRAA